MSALDLEFFVRLGINLLFIGVLCYGSYYRLSNNTAFASSFMLFGTGVYIITYLLHGIEMSMGFAFGLFAVFTMLRYRTESISMKEMTYLFLVIAMSLLSAVGKLTKLELTLLHSLICAIAFLSASQWLLGKCRQQVIRYERIENIRPANRQRLLEDLRQRSGLKVVKVDIDSVDFLRDTAMLTVHYIPEQSNGGRVPPISEPIAERGAGQ